MKATRIISATAAAVILTSASASGVTVVSRTIGDAVYFSNTNGQDRSETFIGAGRYAPVRFDTSVISGFLGAGYVLTSANLEITESVGRNVSNGTLTTGIGTYFLNTAGNSGWTPGNIDADTYVWYGNSAARPGNDGGPATTGDNNVDPRGTSATLEIIGTQFEDGVSFTNHTFNTIDDQEVINIDLTGAGATLLQIESILASWVGGSNGGLGLMAQGGTQLGFESNNIAAGNSVGSTIDGDSALSGNAEGTEAGNGAGGARLILEFTPVPEPSVALLGGLGLLGLLRRRR